MTPSLPMIVAVFAAPAADLPTELWQVAPDARGKGSSAALPRTKDRAVLLIPGLKIHPFRPTSSTRPEFHTWFEPTSELVRTLAKDSDVFAFGYAQTVPLDAVVHSPGLRQAVESIKKAGYTEIVLVGHSVGAVVSRMFAQSYSDSGVTKVIAVAGPHEGCELANLKVGYSKAQAPFVQSITPGARTEAGAARKLNDKIDLACVVCKLKRLDTDGLVNIGSQWSAECQKCGAPAVLAQVNHWEAMHNPTSIKAIAELTRSKLTRWSVADVDKARTLLFRDAE